MSYWEKRKNLKYYKKVLEFAETYGKGRTVLDIGGGQTEYILDIENPEKFLVDVKPVKLEGVDTYTADFMEWGEGLNIDLVTCLQVLEHVGDPSAFMKKIFSISKIAIISVPYKWPEGICGGHIWDPIDMDMFMGWAGREPIDVTIVKERIRERIVAVFKGDKHV